MTGLEAPLALLGLVVTPAIIAAYWLHRRSRPLPVSSDFLWRELPIVRQGGRRLERQERSVLLLLELLIVGLLVTAAAGPWMSVRTSVRPLVVIVDDSFSMRAGGNVAARIEAVEALDDELSATRRARVTWVVAGAQPEVVAESAAPRGIPQEVADAWRCLSPAADLAAALALGLEAGGANASVLVVTDHPPEAGWNLDGDVRWLAFGRARPNMALVGADRRTNGGHDRCLVQVANLSDVATTPRLEIAGVDAASPVVELRAGERRQVMLELPPLADVVTISLPADGLLEDNSVRLLPAVRPRLQVATSVSAPGLRRALQRALAATGEVEAASDRADLVITDGDLPAMRGREWMMRVIAEAGSVAYVGPFVLDQGHPLLDGVSLDGVIWSAGRGYELAGDPVLAVGNVVLIGDTVDGSGRHTIRIRLDADRSTLTRSPDFPILIANLVRWRQSHLPGPTRPNVAVGDTVSVVVGGDVQEVEVADPDDSTRMLPVTEGGVELAVRAPGVTIIGVGDQRFRVAANLAEAHESDLRGLASGTWGDWRADDGRGLGRRSVAWVAALAALALVAVHQALLQRWRWESAT